MSVFKPSKTYKPFTFPFAMEMAEEHNIALYWDKHQVDLGNDYAQFHSKDGLATENVSHESTQNMLEKILSLFTQMDVAAGGLYCELLPYVKNNEIRNMWMNFAAKESVHQRNYALGVEELGFPESTWGEFMEYKEMQDKIDLMSDIDDRDLNDKVEFAKTVAQLLLAEGICLFGAFACMLNLKRYGKMLGLNQVNSWSLKDEQRHVEGNIKVLNEVRKELTPMQNMDLDLFIVKMTEDFIAAELLFIDLVFSMGDQEGMTAQDMKDYIKYLGMVRLEQLGIQSQKRKNPLMWMDWMLSGKKHGNFFEQRITEYDHSGMEGEIDYNDL